MIPSLPFVGRTSELADVQSFLDGVRDGQPGGLLVQGAPGIGKSRLVEAARSAAGDDTRWAGGRAFELEAGTPYAVFAEALAPVVRGLEEHRLEVLTRGWSRELSVLLPGVLPFPDDEAAPRNLTSDETTHRLRWILRDLLFGLTRDRPLILLLDDLQWADEPSLDLLHFLLRSLDERSAALGIVGVVRLEDGSVPPHLDRVRRSLTSLGRLSSLTLRPLEEDDLSDLLRQTFELSRGLAEETARDLHRWTGGNPLYLRELLQTWTDSGRLREEEGAWVGWVDRDLVVPESLEALLTTRLDRLSDPARTLAEHAAALARGAPEDLLGRVTELDRDTFLDALEEIVGRGLLERDESNVVPTWAFPHDLQRTAVYERIPRARRPHLHARIASALLERRSSADPTSGAFEVANHLLRTPPSELTAPGRAALLNAAEVALEVGVHTHAEHCYRFVLKADPGEADHEARTGLARSLQLQGHYAEGEALLQEALETADHLEDTAAAADALRSLGLAAYWQGDRERALELLSDARTRGEVAGDGELLARIDLARGTCLQELGRLDEAATTLQDGLEGAPPDAMPDALRARYERGLFMAYAWRGDTERAWSHGQEAQRLSREVGELDLSWSIHWARAVVHGLTGDGERFVEALEDLRKVEAGLRSPLRRLLLAELEIHYSWATGSWNEGLAVGEEAIRLARVLDQQPLLVRLLVWTANILLRQGDVEASRAYFEEAWAKAGPDGALASDIHARVAAQAGMAHLAMEQDRHDEAIALSQTGLALASGVGYVVWGIYQLLPVLAESLLRARRMDEAAQLGRRLREDSAALGHQLGLAWADAAEALRAWLDGDTARAAELLGEAADTLDGIPMVPDAARLRRQLAGRLAELGRRDEALGQLEQVHAQFEEMGAVPELDKTRGMFREIGARPPPRGAETRMELLTEREAEVAELASRGDSNKAIGKALGISHRTVGTHLSRIYRKLGVSTRTALAAELLQGGD